MDIRTLCLGILQFEDATGYEINKLVADGRFSHFIEASYGSIYPALTKLMAQELVTCREQVCDGRPSRKIYSITKKGQHELLGALQGLPKPNSIRSEFLFYSLFAEQLNKDHMTRVVEKHEDDLVGKLHDLRQAFEMCDHPGSRFTIGYGIAANEAALSFIRANKKMLLEGGEAKTKHRHKSEEQAHE